MAVSKVAGIAFERRGHGQPLLLVHGTGGARCHWRPLVELLAVRRELLIVDLPDHGESDPPGLGVSLTPEGHARRLAGLLDELGLTSAHVAGNSLGGWAALELAKLGRARSVVALAPAGLWARQAPRSSRLRLRGQYVFGRVTAPLLPSILRTEAGRRLVLGAAIARPSQMPPDDATALVAAYVHTRGFAKHLATTRYERFVDGHAIHVPVTVAWGEHERLLPASARRRDQLPAHTRYLTLPGCGHVPMWDNPRLIADTILDGTPAASDGDRRAASPA